VNDIFLFLFLTSLVFIILGIVKPKRFDLFRKNKRITGGLGYTLLAIVFFILFGMTMPEEEVSQEKPNNKVASTESTKEAKTKDEIVSKETKSKLEKNDKKEALDEKHKKNNDAKKLESKDNPSNNKKLETVSLVKTIDGDTIKVKYKGKEKTVRYLLVDTPETKKTNSCIQPYGKDASERNKELVNSGKLELEFDKGDRTDKYDRLLAYVYVDGKSVQESLLKEGLARVAYVYEPNTKYLDQYKKDENIAKSKQLAIWSKSNYVTDKGFNGCVTKKTNKEHSKQKTAPKKDITPNNNKINIPSSSPAPKPAPKPAPVPKTGGAEVFSNCTELRKKYPNGVPSSHPAYRSKMDRDHDNYACER